MKRLSAELAALAPEPGPPVTLAWGTPLREVAAALCYIICHTVVAAALLVAASFLEWLVKYIGNPILFGVLPAGYIFEAIDVAILCVFGIAAIVRSVKVFRG